MAGFEPATARLRIECSTTEPHRQMQLYSIAGLRGDRSMHSCLILVSVLPLRD